MDIFCRIITMALYACMYEYTYVGTYLYLYLLRTRICHNIKIGNSCKNLKSHKIISSTFFVLKINIPIHPSTSIVLKNTNEKGSVREGLFVFPTIKMPQQRTTTMDHPLKFDKIGSFELIKYESCTFHSASAVSSRICEFHQRFYTQKVS